MTNTGIGRMTQILFLIGSVFFVWDECEALNVCGSKCPKIRRPSIPKVKDVIPIIINPAAPIHKEAAKILEPVVSDISKGLGADPEKAKELLNVVADPVPTAIHIGKETIIHLGNTTASTLKADLLFAEGVLKGDLKKIGTAMVDLSGAYVAGALNPGVMYLLDMTVGLLPLDKSGDLMEEPQIQLVEPDSKSSPSKGLEDPMLIYYVNGMLTPLEVAIDEAKALANHLRRPVGLIHNNTTNEGEDAFQAIYDRAWPIAMAGRLGLPSGKAIQINRTTRQLTHLLVHTPRKHISIVTHSQGCLIMRNALLTASRLRGHNWIERGTRWVATGVPLRNEEIFVKINRFTPLANKNDAVGQAIGLRLLPKEDIQSNLSGHDFRTGYVPSIRAEYLW
ncbi:MAG: hypothetical protein AAB433_23005 [Nitrospirota bacterium]